MNSSMYPKLGLVTALAVAFAANAVVQSRRAVGPRFGGVTAQNWELTPAGVSVLVGERPFGMLLSPDGKRLAVSNSGQGEQSVMLIDTRTNDIVRTASVPRPAAVQFGLAWSPDSRTLYAAGGSSNTVRFYDASDDSLKLLATVAMAERKDANDSPAYANGLSLSRDGAWLWVANTLDDTVTLVDVVQRKVVVSVAVEAFPYAVQLSADGGKVYVSNWGAQSVSVIAVEERKLVGAIKVGEHPSGMALSLDGARLFVANSNSDTVSVIDTGKDAVVGTISLAPYPGAPFGSQPNALTVSSDGRTLFVANGGNNDLAVVRLDGEKPSVTGLIPTGWYTTGVQASKDGKLLYALSAKGLGAGPNPLFGAAGAPVRQYIGAMMRGIVSAIPMPSEATLATYTKQVIANNGFDERRAQRTFSAPPTAVPRRVGDPSPIKHVIYIVKENRTYDQVLGDIPQGNGDPSLTLFPREVTPNHHALAEEFVLLDNFYVDGTVSEDGHPWSFGAIAIDTIEKGWPPNYGSRRPQWGGPLYHPTAGYLWDACRRKGLTFRSYGAMGGRVSEGQFPGAPGLVGHLCANYRPTDANRPDDQQRADVFLKEFEEFVQNDNLPSFIAMSLPADHTRATTPGAFTPRAMVADNDLALARIVEAVSKSKYWGKTAIFVVEDDAQNGPDHVDAHRTVALVISPYTKRKVVDSTVYDTCSMLRTMELILGLPPLTQFDAAATPMLNCFTNQANPKPYTALPARISLTERNTLTAYGAQECAKWDWTEIDDQPWEDFNRILWHSIKGRHVALPTPHTNRRSSEGTLAE